MSVKYDHEERYKGFVITVIHGNPAPRVPAVITGKNGALMGAGIGTDLVTAVAAAKTKIDQYVLNPKQKKFSIKD